MIESMKKERIDKIVKLLSEGEKQQDIADLFNISRALVAKIMKDSYLESEDIRKIKIINKLKEVNVDFSDIEYWWNKQPTIEYIQKNLVSIECKINCTNSIKYILKDILKVKRKCKVCNKGIEIESRSPCCSDECRNELKRDHSRTGQHNRRVKSGGKTAQQTIIKSHLIIEANNICYLCGEKFDSTITDWYHPLYIVEDHVDAISYSWNGSKENFKPTCRCCNEKKWDRPKDFFTMDEYKENKKVRLANYIPKIANFKLIDNDEFLIDFNNGMKDKELSAKYNKSINCIYRTKRNLGLTNKKNKSYVRLDKEYAIQEVTKLTKEGKSILEIAKILNVSISTIDKFRKLGGYVKNVLPYKADKVAKVAKVDKVDKVDKLDKVDKVDKHINLDKEYIIEEVARLYKEGKTIYEISKILNIVRVRAWKYLEPVISKKILEVHNNIKDKLLDSAEHDNAISRIAGVHLKTVYKYRKKFNW